MIKIISLNINGIRRGYKRTWVKNLVREHKVCLICIQETKSDSLTDWDVKAIWGRKNQCWATSPSVGNSGGIITIWDSDIIEDTQQEISRYMVITTGRWKGNRKKMGVAEMSFEFESNPSGSNGYLL